MNKSGFCPIPWIHSMLNLDGGYWMCCLASEQKTKISPPEAAFKYPHKNYRNSDTLKEVRSSMIKGILPDTCEGCKLDEKLGNRSKRIGTLEQYPEEAKKAMLKTKHQLIFQIVLDIDMHPSLMKQYLVLLLPQFLILMLKQD